MPIAYSPDALVYDAGSNSWSLRKDYDPLVHRVNIEIFDDDGFLDGDLANDEVGTDTTQDAVVYDMSGTAINKGQVYGEQFFAIWDGVNPHIYLEQIEIAGVHVGWIVNAPLEYGVSYTQSANEDTVSGKTAPAYSSFTDVPCFAPDTMILTPDGEVPVQWLTQGDLVQTRDSGPQKLAWVGRYTLDAAILRTTPTLHPVRIEPDRSGPDAAARALFVSPNHRMLVEGPALSLNLGHDAALCAAKWLAPQCLPRRIGRTFSYHHLLFDAHQIVRANGMWSESLFTGDQSGRIASATGVRPPEHIQHLRTALPCLREWEARVAVGRAPRADVAPVRATA